MRHEPIAEVGVDDRGRLFVSPSDTSFEGIWRAARGVQWDRRHRALMGPEPQEWSLADWLHHIRIAAMEEYGVALNLTAATRWTNVSQELRSALEAAGARALTGEVEEQRRKDEAYWRRFQLGQVFARADPLWTMGRYSEYVQLLAPFRDQLSPAQQKRLAIAERRWLGAVQPPSD